MLPPDNRTSDLLPLRQPTFLILLSLAQAQKHGYAILKDVEELSRGTLRLSTGTLYEALARLLDQDLIERLCDDQPGSDAAGHPGKPRKAYLLTQRGRRLLESETHRIQDLVMTAQLRLGGESS
jgi:DNA-binding PadR family transcriptional regulator